MPPLQEQEPLNIVKNYVLVTRARDTQVGLKRAALPSNPRADR